ncbi:MAG: hypothetical protein A2664_03615 [Candidatus Taylorbacteria bacterium RIFCSPHIGHO2_01_FULL_46_22b]|uniref:DUF378 domain-containing protein n=1 Tax=Candidatus Taylorbacteria bacterium RIFCSPHIGHO2_01_FULL_46_22b TaxID=1802301 RepID=A0A1G2M1C0_9BACT|nr:MAG: hypothetical protein A2664_03615 [Candidatus Taylorbacteria bacterium RIFCSPHIGHO2_01_FULL_46_22b]
MKLHTIAFILLIVGGLNWLLVGLFQWDIGSILGGMSSMLSRLVYILVGASAIYEIATHKSRCKNCEKGASSAPAGGSSM